MKPSETIGQQAHAYLEKLDPPVSGLIDVEVHEARAFLRFVLEYLDAEHERREKWEAEVAQRLDILERSQRDVLTRLPEPNK